MKVAYQDIGFHASTMEVIHTANEIIEEYDSAGYSLTLRQLYYQFVARDLIRNTEQSYKRLGKIVSDARLAGLISWTAIEDRTRNLRGITDWSNPQSIIDAAASSYHIDEWEDQDFRPEVWIEKDALLGVIERPCRELDVDYFACRGYVSQSEMWSAAMRLKRYHERGQTPVIIHLGDHDPSGVDMTRDVLERMELFLNRHGFEAPDVERIALNMDQVRLYDPPPNPAKLSDSRAGGYIERYGRSSWELDALDPKVLDDLVRGKILSYRNETIHSQIRERMEEEREHLLACSERWPDVVDYLDE